MCRASVTKETVVPIPLSEGSIKVLLRILEFAY